MKKVIMWILVILWMGVIFYFSSFSGKDSTDQSQGFLSTTIRKVVLIFDKDISEENLNVLVKKLDRPIRKCAHMSEYLVLCILLCILIGCYNFEYKRLLLIAFITSVLYSISDEVHQLFVFERSGQILDVFIDSIGSLIGLVLYNLINNNKK